MFATSAGDMLTAFERRVRNLAVTVLRVPYTFSVVSSLVSERSILDKCHEKVERWGYSCVRSLRIKSHYALKVAPATPTLGFTPTAVN